MIICTYFWEQNQLLILSSLQMSPQKQSQTDRRRMNERRGRNKWDIPAHCKWERAASPSPPNPIHAHFCILKPTLSHQTIQAWNANLTTSNSLNNPPPRPTVRSDITSNCHLHSFKISSHFKISSFCPHWLISRVMNVSYLVGRELRWEELKWASGTSPLEHSPRVPKAESHQRSLHTWAEAEGQNLSRNSVVSCCFASCDKMWLFVTCITNKERRLNERGFGRKGVPFFKTTVSKEVEELSSAEKPPPTDLASLAPLVPPGYYNTTASGLTVSGELHLHH